MNSSIFLLLASLPAPAVLIARRKKIGEASEGYNLLIIAAIMMTFVGLLTYLNQTPVGTLFDSVANAEMRGYIVMATLFLPSIGVLLVGLYKWIPYVSRLQVEVEQRKRAEERLRHLTEELEIAANIADHANKAKSDFLAGMSHELRTPLNAIIGFSEMMRQEVFGSLSNPNYKEYADMIYKSGHHLLDIINDILDLAKVESGKMDLQDDIFCVGHLAKESLKMVEGGAKDAGIHLIAKITPDIPVMADWRVSKQMVLNLLSNALKFTPKGGEVTVATFEMPDGSYAVMVNDTGIGMNDHEIEKALLPFEQNESILTRSHEGTGLGLVLVKTFIEMHGGRLIINSQKGIGTSVCLNFPRERVRVSEAPLIIERERLIA